MKTTKKWLAVALSVVMMLTMCIGALAAGPQTSPEVTQREEENLEDAKTIALESMVLLENNGALPMAKEGTVALYGVGVRNTVGGGTGSGAVNNRYTETVEDGFEAAGYEISQASRDYIDAVGIATSSGGGWWASINYQSFEIDVADYISNETDTAIYVITRNSGEGSDRYLTVDGVRTVDYGITDLEMQNIRTLENSYKNFIVVLNVGGVYDTSFMDTVPVDALVLMSQAGAKGGSALVQLLNGTVNFSGHLTDTWAINYSDYPNSGYIAYNDDNVIYEIYEEGIYIGYRYFDTFGLDVRYPFGYGLSYTDFLTDIVSVEADAEYVTVKAKVTNTGKCAGKESVQVYFSAPAGAIDKPYQELASYVKTDTLEPNESQIVTTKFLTTEMSSYDEARAAYVMEDGDYIIRVGNNSRNTKIAAVLTLAQDVVTEKTSNLFHDIEGFDGYENLGELGKRNGYMGETVLSSEGAPGPIFDTTAEYANVVRAALDFADYITVNNTSEYLDKKVKTYVRANKYLDYSESNIYNGTKIADYEDGGPSVVTQAHEEEIVAVSSCPDDVKLIDVYNGEITMEQFVSTLTIDQLCYITHGDGTANPFNATSTTKTKLTMPNGAAGYTTAQYEDSKGIPSTSLPDGPAGIRITRQWTTDDVTYYQHCTRIPIATCYAQAFDTDITTIVGDIIGEEMYEYGATTWLAPGLNIHANPICGRNFEYYSEDPLVTGLTAATVTLGVQRWPGVGVTLKHYAGNNQESARNSANTSATERTWREIYLKGFEIAVKMAQPEAIMTSYNKVNGAWASTNYDLNTNILRGEWGYGGYVMTDWGGVHTSVVTIQSGNDLVMPGGQNQARTMLGQMTGEKTYIYVGDLQLAAMRIIRSVMNSIQMEELTEGAVEPISYTDFNLRYGGYNAPVATNERGLVDFILTDKDEIAAFEPSVEAPESAATGERFTITANTLGDVIGFKLLNENGANIKIIYAGAVLNEDGTKTWTIITSVGTAGEREFTLIPISEETGYQDPLTFGITIVDSVDPFSIISAEFAKAAVVKNVPVELNIVAGQKLTEMGVYNEKGAKMGKTLIAKTANENGTFNWDYSLRIGTAGDRVFTVQGRGISGYTTNNQGQQVPVYQTDTAEASIIVI